MPLTLRKQATRIMLPPLRCLLRVPDLCAAAIALSLAVSGWSDRSVVECRAQCVQQLCELQRVVEECAVWLLPSAGFDGGALSHVECSRCGHPVEWESLVTDTATMAVSVAPVDGQGAAC